MGKFIPGTFAVESGTDTYKLGALPAVFDPAAFDAAETAVADVVVIVPPPFAAAMAACAAA